MWSGRRWAGPANKCLSPSLLWIGRAGPSVPSVFCRWRAHQRPRAGTAPPFLGTCGTSRVAQAHHASVSPSRLLRDVLERDTFPPPARPSQANAPRQPWEPPISPLEGGCPRTQQRPMRRLATGGRHPIPPPPLRRVDPARSLPAHVLGRRTVAATPLGSSNLVPATTISGSAAEKWTYFHEISIE